MNLRAKKAWLGVWWMATALGVPMVFLVGPLYTLATFAFLTVFVIGAWRTVEAITRTD